MRVMVMSKDSIIEALQDLPDDADLADVIDYLVYLSGIEEGLEDERAGNMISHDELLERIKTWPS